MTAVTDSITTPLLTPLVTTLDEGAVGLRDLFAADLVLVSPPTIERRLREWGEFLEAEGRRDVVVTGEGNSEAPVGHVGAVSRIELEEFRPAFKLVLRPVKGPGHSVVEVDEGVRAAVAEDGSALCLAVDRRAQASVVAEHAARGLPVVETGPGPLPNLTREHLRRASVMTRRWLGRHHSIWAHADRVAALLGLDLPPSRPLVSALLMTNRSENIRPALEGMAKQDYPRLEVILGLHGSHDQGWEEVMAEMGLTGTVVEIPADQNLGRGLNTLAAASRGQIQAKIDDDDRYGPAYMTDAVIALWHSGADAVGKAARYVHYVPSKTTYLLGGSLEDRWVGYAPGPSLVFARGTWERVPFAHRHSRVDSTFVQGLQAAGLSLWSTTRDELVIERSNRGHTWEASEDFFRARGREMEGGFGPDNAFIPNRPGDWPSGSPFLKVSG